MNVQQIAATAILLGVCGLFHPRAAWLTAAVFGIGYLWFGIVPFGGWSWSAP